jgi:alpha/beta superfamily hydrolase
MAEVRIPGEQGQPSLEGIWLGSGERTAVVAPPHPLMGGSLASPVVQALAMGLGAAGVRALLFNWRGVGESDGMPSGAPEDAEQDYLSALALAARAGGEAIAAGYSFGAVAALRVASRDARARAVVAVAPPPYLLAGFPALRLRGATIIAADGDTIALASELSELAERTRSRFELLTDTDHFFGRALGRISEIARDAVV